MRLAMELSSAKGECNTAAYIRNLIIVDAKKKAAGIDNMPQLIKDVEEHEALRSMLKSSNMRINAIKGGGRPRKVQ